MFLDLGNDFLTVTPSKLNLCFQGYYLKKVKGQPTEWEEIFANYISEKGLVSIICENLTNQQQKGK